MPHLKKKIRVCIHYRYKCIRAPYRRTADYFQVLTILLVCFASQSLLHHDGSEREACWGHGGCFLEQTRKTTVWLSATWQETQWVATRCQA